MSQLSANRIIGFAAIGSWMLIGVWIFWSSLTQEPVDVKDVHIGMAFWMMLLSFPSGVLIFMLLPIAIEPFGTYFELAWAFHPWFFCLVWLCYFFAGLAQWLLLMRWINKRRLRSRSATTR